MQRTPRLKALRERAALSQEDLAEISKVARATIADLEAGKRPARPSTIRKLAEGLGVEVTDLYGEPDSPLGEAPSSQEQLFNNGVLEGRRAVRGSAHLRGTGKLEAAGERIMGVLKMYASGELSYEEAAEEVGEILTEVAA